MMSKWGFSESPLVDGDRVLCTTGSDKAMIVCLNKKTGDEIWRSSVPDQGEKGKPGAGYSSIVISEGAGVKQYVQLIGRGLIGVRASDGKLLWSYNHIANGVADIPTAIVRGDYVFGSTGYGDGGSGLLKLVRNGDGVDAVEQYYKSAKELQNHHGGMILIGDHLYLGHGHNEGFPTCIDLISGDLKWGKVRGAGSNSACVTYVDGHIIYRYQSGDVALVEATPDAYKLKGSFKPVFQEKQSWAHPVVVKGKLYLREQNVLMCYDLTK
jgi:outer membrane protein assembly factor BamB